MWFHDFLITNIKICYVELMKYLSIFVKFEHRNFKLFLPYLMDRGLNHQRFVYVENSVPSFLFVRKSIGFVGIENITSVQNGMIKVSLTLPIRLTLSNMDYPALVGSNGMHTLE